MIGRIDYRTTDGVNTQHVITLPAADLGSGLHWVILALEVIFDGTPPSADITITGLDAATAIPILSANSDKNFAAAGNFFLGLENTSVVVTVPAGGAGVRSLVYMTSIKLLAGNIERLYFGL